MKPTPLRAGSMSHRCLFQIGGYFTKVNTTNRNSINARLELQEAARLIEKAQRQTDASTTKKLDEALVRIGVVYKKIREDETLIVESRMPCRICKKFKSKLDINKVCKDCDRKMERRMLKTSRKKLVRAVASAINTGKVCKSELLLGYYCGKCTYCKKRKQKGE